MMCGAELKPLPEGVQRVARVLQDKDHPHGPVMLDDAARTAQQAADALGIALGQIAKSIAARLRRSGPMPPHCRNEQSPRPSKSQGHCVLGSSS